MSSSLAQGSQWMRHETHRRGAEMTALTDTVRELDHRTGEDIDVRLLWEPRG